MMETRQAYNVWASQYDTNQNKTRDLEAIALRETLQNIRFEHCLEIGCGTGKNTAWLLTKADRITAVDQSEEMMARAREKINAANVTFVMADIRQPWAFGAQRYDLVTFSLVLEHIEALEPVFEQVSASLVSGGYVYLGELHPFKQYAGTRARFDTAEGQTIVDCYTHHVSDFTAAAGKHGLQVAALNEYFDENERNNIPRILTLLFRKN